MEFDKFDTIKTNANRKIFTLPHSYQAWARDYIQMKPMLFGEVEEFTAIVQRIRDFVELEFKK